VVRKFKDATDKSGFKAHLGKCKDDTRNEKCTEQGLGQITQVYNSFVNVTFFITASSIALMQTSQQSFKKNRMCQIYFLH